MAPIGRIHQPLSADLDVVRDSPVCGSRCAPACAAMRERREGSVAPFVALSPILGSNSGRYGDAMTDDNEDDDEEFEPLELVPVPVSINAHDPDVGGPLVVRLFFRAGGHSGWPGGGISDVFVIEDGERVSIGLVRREVDGQGPDGMMYGPSLAMGGGASLDVVLSCPLGTRSLLDASTGELVPRVEHLSGDRSPAAGAGTPVWRWS
jgi:hypothetical protein